MTTSAKKTEIIAPAFIDEFEAIRVYVLNKAAVGTHNPHRQDALYEIAIGLQNRLIEMRANNEEVSNV